MNKKPKYQSRKQMVKAEKIRTLILAVIFVLICLVTGLTSFFVAKGSNGGGTQLNNGNTEQEKDETKQEETEEYNPELTLQNLDDISEPVGEEINIIPQVLLNSEVLENSTDASIYKLQYELVGNLPNGLIFDSATGTISGSEEKICEVSTYYIRALYYADKTKSACLTGRSNNFTIEIYGLSFANTIADINCFADDGEICTTVPVVKFKNQVINNENISFELQPSNYSYPGLTVNSNGTISGTPTAHDTNNTDEPTGANLLQWKARYDYLGKQYIVSSNQFKILVNIKSVNIEIKTVGKLVTEVNGNPFDIGFEVEINGEVNDEAICNIQNFNSNNLPHGVYLSSSDSKIYGTPDGNDLEIGTDFKRSYAALFEVAYQGKTCRRTCTFALEVKSSFELNYEYIGYDDIINKVIKKPSENSAENNFIFSMKTEDVREAGANERFASIVKINHRDFFSFNNIKLIAKLGFEYEETPGEWLTIWLENKKTNPSGYEDLINDFVEIDKFTGEICFNTGEMNTQIKKNRMLNIQNLVVQLEIVNNDEIDIYSFSDINIKVNWISELEWRYLDIGLSPLQRNGNDISVNVDEYNEFILEIKSKISGEWETFNNILQADKRILVVAKTPNDEFNVADIIEPQTGIIIIHSIGGSAIHMEISLYSQILVDSKNDIWETFETTHLGFYAFGNSG